MTKTALQLAKLAVLEHDDLRKAMDEHSDVSSACLDCGAFYGIEGGFDPTPFCHSCAQENLKIIAGAFLRLHKKTRSRP